MGDATKPFATVSNRAQIREILSSVYDSLMLKGYNPINQLVGTSSPRTPRISPTTTTPARSSAASTAMSCCRQLVRSYLEDKE